MPLMPKRVKFRKSQRGKVKGNATARQHGQLRRFRPAGPRRRLAERRVDRGGPYDGDALHPRRRPAVHPRVPAQVGDLDPAETRMGKGKGEPEFWAAVVKPGMILYRIAGLPEAAARDAWPGWRTRCRSAAAGGAAAERAAELSEGAVRSMKPSRIARHERRAAGPALKETVKNLFHLRFQSATDRWRRRARSARPSGTWPGSRPFSASDELAAAARTESRQSEKTNGETANGGKRARRRRRRHQRQDEQDPARRDSAPGQASALRQVHQAPDDLPRPRREERVAHRRHGRDHGDAAALQDQELAADVAS